MKFYNQADKSFGTDFRSHPPGIKCRLKNRQIQLIFLKHSDPTNNKSSNESFALTMQAVS